MNELEELLRMRRLDRRNCDEEAKEVLMGQAADEIAKLREALRYYADPKRWQEFRITEGDIFGARHGDFGFAFNADSDNPWSVASLVL